MHKPKVLSSGFAWMAILSGILFICNSSYMICNLSYAATQDSSEAQYGGTYNAPLPSEPITLDPAYYIDIYSMNVAANLFDGLVEFDKDLNVVPSIARKWKISRDHRTYTFLLKEGVKFHNDREVTAKDFIFSFSRILSPDIQSPVASFFLNIQGAKEYRDGENPAVTGLIALNPYTLVIQLEQPFAPFLSILAMVNAKVIPEEEVDSGFGKNPVGTGPFRFRTWEPGKQIILEANEDYFDDRPFLNNLRFLIYPNIDWEQMFNDFNQGILEHSFIPSEQYEKIVSSNSGEKPSIISKPGLNLVYVGMNMDVSPFNDLQVRQAINYAIDTETIVKQITKRGSIPAKGIVPPGIAGYDPNFKGYPYEPQKARELLTQAGYPEGRGFPPIEIWTISKAESVQRELQAYQHYLAEVGIELIPKLADDWQELVKVINEKRAPMFYAAWYADYPDPDNFFYPLCYSKSNTNRMRLNDPELDRLLNQAREEVDYMKRVELYRNIEKRVMHNAPLIPQHVNSNNYLFHSWVQGVELSHLGAVYLPFRKVWIDQIKLAAQLPKVKSNKFTSASTGK